MNCNQVSVNHVLLPVDASASFNDDITCRSPCFNIWNCIIGTRSGPLLFSPFFKIDDNSG
ncbi:MAG: hypothetical protein JXR76_11965 [Deltaproteobacteria bacterium]|nr:hypothetical protein [Deltaproteobacteria bacterium]